MPVILDKKGEKKWLDKGGKSLLNAYPASKMKSSMVNPKLNSTKNEGKELLEVQQTL